MMKQFPLALFLALSLCQFKTAVVDQRIIDEAAGLYTIDAIPAATVMKTGGQIF